MESKNEVKSRDPNFTLQECHLLVELMGAEYKDMKLSRHKVDKHRFTDSISSATKKQMWRGVEEAFNANSTNRFRKATDLQKKWKILVAKHRAIYSDYIRDMNTTGSGLFSTKYSLLTEAVMAVIGKDSVAVGGDGGVILDSTMNQLKQNSEKRAVSDEAHGSSKRNEEQVKRNCLNAESTETSNS